MAARQLHTDIPLNLHRKGLDAMCRELVEDRLGPARFESYLCQAGYDAFLNDFRFWLEIQKYKQFCHARGSIHLVRDKVWEG